MLNATVAALTEAYRLRQGHYLRQSLSHIVGFRNGETLLPLTRGDGTGGAWCYVDFFAANNCPDLQTSDDGATYGFGRRRLWSKQVCAAPDRDSEECRNRNFPSLADV